MPGGGRHVLHDGLEERRQIDRWHLEIRRRHTVTRRRIDHGRIQLCLVRLELDEEIQHFIVHPHGIGPWPIDLVDHDDRRPSECERLTEHEARLRHRPIEGVHDEQHPIHHPQNPLDFSAEVAVARGVHDVDLGPPPPDRRVLCEDGDAPLALERIRIHHPLHYDLVLAKCAGLPQHLVHESRLAVVDVRDDGHVPDLHSRLI